MSPGGGHVYSGDDDDCPICLEPLASFDAHGVALLPCGHPLCSLCLVELYWVQQASAQTHGQVSCPICRCSHPVESGGDASAALRRLSGGVGAGSAAPAPAAAPSRGLDNLRPAELKVVAATVGARIPAGGWLDRRELEAAIRECCSGASSSDDPLAQLPVKALKALLAHRRVPCDDCVERGELQLRVLQTPRGNLVGLPVAILKKMLRQFGCQDEQFVEKSNLARRVMAVSKPLTHKHAAAAATTTTRKKRAARRLGRRLGTRRRPRSGNGLHRAPLRPRLRLLCRRSIAGAVGAGCASAARSSEAGSA